MGIFIGIAALMIAASLALVLKPLLSGAAALSPTLDAKRKLKLLDQARAAGLLGDDEYAAKRTEIGKQILDSIDASPRNRSATTIALIVALLLPVTAIVMYRAIGTPQALDATNLTAAGPADHGRNMDEAIGKLADKLKENPGDAEGWALLGRAYEETGHFTEARDAMKKARDLAPDDADVAVAYAEALALTDEAHRIQGEPLALIDEVLKKNPDHQRALWLRGISDYQNKKYNDAITTWKHLLTVLPKDASVTKSVQTEIARAEAARDGREIPDDNETAAAENVSPGASTSENASANITVKVSLSPKLKDKVAPGDTLFVFAKAANGPPMPLAIQRTTADKLPLTVTLTDAMGMMPTMKLSQFPQVVIGARVSKSGNALAQSGDLQTLSPPIPVTRTEPIELTIDQVVP